MTGRARRLRLRHIHAPRAAMAFCAVIAGGGVVEATAGGAPITGALDALTGVVLVATWARLARTDRAVYARLTKGNRQ